MDSPRGPEPSSSWSSPLTSYLGRNQHFKSSPFRSLDITRWGLARGWQSGAVALKQGSPSPITGSTVGEQGWRAEWAEADTQHHIPLLSTICFTWDRVYLTTKKQCKKKIAVEHLWINLACIINVGPPPKERFPFSGDLLLNELGRMEVSSVNFRYCGDAHSVWYSWLWEVWGNPANFPVHPGWAEAPTGGDAGEQLSSLSQASASVSCPHAFWGGSGHTSAYLLPSLSSTPSNLL